MNYSCYTFVYIYFFQPGKKELYLKKILDTKTEDKKNPTPLSIKWKDMPTEKRKVIEIERQRAIQMYRMLKNKKMNS